MFLFLIEDKNPGADNGWTPLHCAADNDHLDVCKLIMDNVKDIKPKNNNGKTPFQLAIKLESVLEIALEYLDTPQPKGSFF